MLKFKIIFTILIASFILLNTLNKDIYGFHGLMPNELIIIVIFIFLVLKNRMFFTWMDKAFFVFFVLSIIIPLTLNYPTSNPGAFGILLPLKTWMVYRISLRLFKIGLQRKSTIELIHIVLNITIVSSAAAALIGILRYMKFAEITAFINHTWPAKEIFLNPDTSGRLSSTMSGVNGSGIFFAAVTIISLYMYQKKQNSVYPILIIIFIYTMLLTGSFTASACLVIVFVVSYRRLIHSIFITKNFMVFIFSFLLFIFAVLQIGNLKHFFGNVVENRIERQFYKKRSPYEFIPYSLYGRAIRWPGQLSILIEKPVFGYGSDIPVDRIVGLVGSANSHNYYVYILMQGGIIGFVAYLRFKFILLKKSMVITYSKEKNMIVSILAIFLISQITSLTFQYGGISELYGVIMAFIFYLGVDSRSYPKNMSGYSTCSETLLKSL